MPKSVSCITEANDEVALSDFPLASRLLKGETSWLQAGKSSCLGVFCRMKVWHRERNWNILRRGSDLMFSDADFLFSISQSRKKWIYLIPPLLSYFILWFCMGFLIQLWSDHVQIFNMSNKRRKCNCVVSARSISASSISWIPCLDSPACPAQTLTFLKPDGVLHVKSVSLLVDLFFYRGSCGTQVSPHLSGSEAGVS